MTQAEEPKGRRDFVKYSFFKVSPQWRQLPKDQRERGKREFAEVIGEFSGRQLRIFDIDLRRMKASRR